MVKRNTILLLFLTFLLGCDDNEVIFTGPYHVRFTEENITYKESHSPIIPISVHLVSPQIDERIEITYSIDGDAREGIDYEIANENGKIIIPKGESFGYIDLQLLNNSNNILDRHTIEFSLISVTPSYLDIGFGSGVKAGKDLTFIIVDDCILGGSYTGTYLTNTAPIEGIQVTSTDCISYNLANWDVNVFDFPSVRNLTFTDNGDNTLNIPEQEEQTFNPEFATIRGSGIVNPITREITLNIELVDFENEDNIVTVKFKPE